MEQLTAKRIKKILLGVVASDGHIDVVNKRFDFYSRYSEYTDYIGDVVNNITKMHVTNKPKRDKRGYIGYRVWTRKHVYWNNLARNTYSGGRKRLTPYVASRLDGESLAHIWMCDGYLKHVINRKKNKAQNVGFICFEAYPAEEQDLLRDQLRSFSIETSLVKVRWGYGYRIAIRGHNLQKFMSLVYPYILDCFKYKTSLFYKKRENADMNLSNAEEYIHLYECIEDIVRHPLKRGKQ